MTFMAETVIAAGAKGKHQMNSRGKPARKSGAAGASNRRKPPEVAVTAAPERIAKLLARAGVASRREVERMIADGRIRLNGSILDTPAVNVTLADRIEIDGEPLRGIERTRLWLYHKPTGLVTTHKDPEGRPTVFERLPSELPRVLSVGRLDINTEGLLLLTNDGGLARVLELPTTGWLRRYRVRAHGKIDQAALDRLQDGIAVDGVLYGAIEATLDRVQGANVWITMGFREGKNREIKNVLGALGLDVNRLIRISYGPFQLADLKEGEAREVKGRTLRDQLGPRLIEEAGADFEAPLFEENKPRKPDENKRKAAGSRPAKAKPEAGKPRRSEARLETKKPDDKPRKQQRRSRASNVWMAPGARPTGNKSKRKSDEQKPAPGKGKPAKQSNKARPQTKGDGSGRGRSRSGHADRRR